MKTLTILALLICGLSLSNSYSQGITITVNNASLESVFNEIQNQSAYRFIYTNEQLQGTGKVNISVQQATIETVLDRCFKDHPLTYTLDDKYIIVKFKPSYKTEPGKIENTIKGIVISEKDEPITGATVSLKGTKIATTTQEDGSFTFEAVPPGSALIISSVGYEPQEVNVGKNKTLTIHLKISLSGLDEMVIKGYYSTSKRLNTGSVSKVRAEEISKQPVSNPLATLQGRVPGLNIVQNTGLPGGGFSVQIRGQNSLRTATTSDIEGNDPLYIIDGVPFTSTSLTINRAANGKASPLNNINPLDIESIEVLKDADATSIYGSRGSNGVILITTKKGKEGKSKVEINTYTGVGKIPRKLDLLNTQQYLLMRNEAFKNDGATPNLTYDFDLLVWDTTRFTDWQKILIGGTAKISDLQISISGGNSNTQFFVGGGFHKESTVYPGKSGDVKPSAHFNLEHVSENKKLKLSLSTSYVQDINNLISADLTLTTYLPPNAPPIYDSSGNLNWANGTFNNPFANLLKTDKTITSNLLTNAVISYQLLPSLEFKTSLGYTKLEMNENQTVPVTSLNPSSGYKSGFAYVTDNNITTWIIEPQASYKRKVGGGQLNVLAGATLQENISKAKFQSFSGFSSDALLGNASAASQIRVLLDNFTQYRYNAFFSRINYNLQEKYILNLTGRLDGSSRFGPGRQFGRFGSVGGAWIFTKENSIRQLLPFLSFGKIRISYGSSGNDQIGDYQYLSTYSSTSFIYQGITGLLPSRISNPDYAWEISKKFEVGLESGLIQDRILFTASFYRNRSSNQLVGKPLPLMTGFSTVQSNFPALVENSGLEFTLNSLNAKSPKFSWKTYFNITIPRNKLVAFPGIENTVYDNYYTVGKSLNIFKGYHVVGVDPQAGTYLFRDGKGNTTTTPSRPADFIYTKRIGAEIYGGLENSFQYRNFKLDIFFQFTKQNGNENLYVVMPGTAYNQPISVLNRWQNPGDVKPIQRFNQNYNLYSAWTKVNSNSDNVIVDASFIRLKNLSMSYELPASWKQRIGLQNGRFFVQGQNLLTGTAYKGLDPETGGVLPPLKMITAGIQMAL